jgi:3-oxoacyl-[acyl-carrier-protein] synthase II
MYLLHHSWQQLSLRKARALTVVETCPWGYLVTYSGANPSVGPMLRRRVVVTGIGAVCGLGADAHGIWRALLQGQRACRPVMPVDENNAAAAFPTSAMLQAALAAEGADAEASPGGKRKRSSFPSRVASFVPHSFEGVDALEPSGDQPAAFPADGARSLLPRSLASSGTPAFVRFALFAAHRAMLDAGLAANRRDAAPGLEISEQVDLERLGVSLGSAVGGIAETEAAALSAKDESGAFIRMSPFYVPRLLGSMAAGSVSIALGCRGPSLSSSGACAAGALSIAEAALAIQRGEADLMLAGGSESCITPLTTAGFARAGALTTAGGLAPSAEVAASSSRPFDQARDGFVLGEGSAVMVLESLDHAVARGLDLEADIYAELVGIGRSSDAFHITNPEPALGEDSSEGGALRCMRSALRDADLRPDHVSYVNAHGTSTPIGDPNEAAAMQHLFDSGSAPVCVSSIKGHIGHLLGAAGAIEAMATALSVRHRRAPGTANLTELCGSFPALHFPTSAHDLDGRCTDNGVAAMSNSFGFGGTNSSLVFRTPKR